MKKEKYIVTGMTCSACSSRVEKAVSKLEGIGKASVNLLTNSMQVEYDETKLNEANIVQAVVDAGYGATAVKRRMIQSSAQQQAKQSILLLQKQKNRKKTRR